MSLEAVKALLRDVENNWENRNTDNIFELLKVAKQEAVRCGDQEKAKYIWCLEQTTKTQDMFIHAFKENKQGKFYNGWCSLERVEGLAAMLGRHLPSPLMDDFKIHFINTHTQRFQSIYPYGIFISPEFVKQKIYCSICDARISPRSHCGHDPGEIYDGEMCGRIIKSAEVAALAMVKNPVQKYSVPFMTNPKTKETEDQYNYGVVKYLVRALASPFHEWDITKETRRHPHSRFKDVGRNGKCPCESGKKYKLCCLPTEGVLRPHIQFHFSVEPPAEVIKREYI
ncbi:SEC-C metal-binding domain-containing protein [Bdellovibrio sp. KM01]|uniref:SEC-C metal-binding domain-containing protein n=1 Tax=Bdellovibrio sp. KM01 TaxID=2748865 RepID=UPI0015E93B07|nr:SEC-C metal-binding domain-containing protein [Bdellovibrio sp. KM01]QLY25704.1 SEC-C domain-containing protein [Bdellovibrio sp. KM01]